MATICSLTWFILLSCVTEEVELVFILKWFLFFQITVVKNGLPDLIYNCYMDQIIWKVYNSKFIL